MIIISLSVSVVTTCQSTQLFSGSGTQSATVCVNTFFLSFFFIKVLILKTEVVGKKDYHYSNLLNGLIVNFECQAASVCCVK